jgi:hypothetical protein
MLPCGRGERNGSADERYHGVDTITIMRAIIIVSGHAEGISPLHGRYPLPLLPLVDRPFVQHLVEFLAGRGITRLALLLDPRMEQVASFLGDGRRWGCCVVYHRLAEPSKRYALLKAVAHGDPHEPFLLGHADRFVPLPLGETGDANAPVLFCSRLTDAVSPQQKDHWTGWAVLSPEHLAALPDDVDEAALETHLRGGKGARLLRPSLEVRRPLRMDTFAGIIAAHRAVLSKESRTLPLGRESEPGVWVGRKTRLHPTVQFFPPVSVGDNCVVGAGVRLGPHATLVGDCLLDDHAAVSHSVIFPGSYIGPGIDLEDVIVDQKYLIHIRGGRALLVAEDFILGSLAASPSWERSPSLLARAAGLLSPLLARPHSAQPRPRGSDRNIGLDRNSSFAQRKE